MFARSAHLACGSFLWESDWAVAKGFCTHGDDAPVPIPNIMNLQQRKVAANAHILCRVRHVDCLAGVTLESLLRYVL